VLRSRYFYDFNYFSFVMDVMKLYKFPIVETVNEAISQSASAPRLRALHKEALEFIQANKKFEQTGETTESVGPQSGSTGKSTNTTIVSPSLTTANESA
jgi:hypothetical protein